MDAADFADLKDGDYQVKMTHVAGDPKVQFPHTPIADEVYELVEEAKPERLLLRFSKKGKKVPWTAKKLR